MPETEHRGGRDWVAIVLAIGVATALNCITFAVLYDAVISQESGLSENATQVITGAFGGILGVLGSYLGFRAGTERQRVADTAAETPPDAPDEPTSRATGPRVPGQPPNP